MSSLAKLQRNFIRDCLSGENFVLGQALNTDKISAAGQMGIYRESAIGNIIAALKLTYPAVLDLVGEAFFRSTCREYIKGHWPASGNMGDYGAGLATFLEGFAPAKQLAYLPEMARLEWLYHECSLADDTEQGDWGELVSLTVEKIAALKVSFHPSVRLLSSVHPVIKIWEMCQERADQDEKLDLSKEQGVHVLLVRKGLKVDLYPITVGEMAFLRALEAGQALEKAFEAAIAYDDTAVRGYMLKHIEVGTFSKFFV